MLFSVSGTLTSNLNWSISGTLVTILNCCPVKIEYSEQKKCPFVAGLFMGKKEQERSNKYLFYILSFIAVK